MGTSLQPDKLPAIVERLRAGSTALIAESKALGFTHNGPLRAALKQMLGVKGYDELMAGKRPAKLSVVQEDGSVVPVTIDDTGVRTITATPTKDGWRIRYKGGADSEGYLVSPEGQWFERAPANVKADLVVDMSERGLGRARFRKTSPPAPKEPEQAVAAPTGKTEEAAVPAKRRAVKGSKKKAKK